MGKKETVFLSAFAAIIFLLGMVGAYNSPPVGGNPAIMGHSVDEMDWSQMVPNINIGGNAFVGGNVGIGTSTPTEELEVRTSGSDNSVVAIKSDSISSAYASLDFYDGSSNKWGIGKNPSNNFYIDESGVGNRLIIMQGGNVGIGTMSPTQRLHVAGNARITGLASCDTIDTDASGNMICGTDAVGGGDTDWVEAGGNVYRLNGNVGIGTSSPATRLVVDQSSNANSIITVDSGSTTIHYSSVYFHDRGTNIWGIGKDNTNDFFIDRTGAGRALTIDSSTYNVGIGTSSPTQKLEVDGSIRVTAGNDICISGGNCLSSAGSFGTRVSTDTLANDLVVNAVYQAQADGFLLVTEGGGPIVQVLVGNTNPPTNVLALHSWSTSTTYGSMNVPVGKNEYVQVTGTIAGNPDIWWQPIGVGGLLRVS